MLVHVPLELVLDLLGGATQRQLAQRAQVARAEEVRQRGSGSLERVDPPLFEPLAQSLRRDVDQLDLVGLVDDLVRDRLADRHSRDALDRGVQALQVLDVERRDHVDTRGANRLDVHPALRTS